MQREGSGKRNFRPAELQYLTTCDFEDHIVLVMAVLDAEGNEVDGIGVARCIRDPDDPGLAEVAIVQVDEWQHRGTGRRLLRHLADYALAGALSAGRGGFTTATWRPSVFSPGSAPNINVRGPAMA
jgi:GNAT superfamily N-acetyltransferase